MKTEGSQPFPTQAARAGIEVLRRRRVEAHVFLLGSVSICKVVYMIVETSGSSSRYKSLMAGQFLGTRLEGRGCGV